MPRYDRALKKGLQHLQVEGFLAPLLSRRNVKGIELDAHLREGNKISLYLGLTRLVTATLSNESAKLTASKTYRDQECAKDLFGRWPREGGDLEDALATFCANVKVDDRFLRLEGIIQADWARISSPWVPVDREAVIGYLVNDEQIQARDCEEVMSAADEVERLLASVAGWQRFNREKRSAELDQLGVDESGRLVLVELKHPHANASVYYAPLQLLQYTHEWARAVAADGFVEGIRAVQQQREELGLSRTTARASNVLRPVIGFGETYLTGETRSRFEAVLEVANRHLPERVLPMEVWVLSGEGPKQRL